MEITITLSPAARKFLEHYIGSEFERNKGFKNTLGDSLLTVITAMCSHCTVNDLKKLEKLEGNTVKLSLPNMIQVSQKYYRAKPLVDGRVNFVWIDPARQIMLNDFLVGMLRLECKAASDLAESMGKSKSEMILSIFDKYDIEDSEFSLDAILRWLNRQKNKVAL